MTKVNLVLTNGVTVSGEFTGWSGSSDEVCFDNAVFHNKFVEINVTSISSNNSTSDVKSSEDKYPTHFNTNHIMYYWFG